MSECCEPQENRNKQLVSCKECGQIGKAVKRVTLEHLVKDEKASFLGDTTYFFCAAPDCNVVYFSSDKDVFYKSDLKVRVGIKETQEPIPVCYCFNYTKKMILEDIIQNGRSTIQERIAKEAKLGNCQCEVKNPQGSCCLGSVAQIIKYKT